MAFWKKVADYFNIGKKPEVEGKEVVSEARAKFIAEREADTEPWAAFEVVGFEPDGRVKINFNWNKPFSAKLQELGFEAETEEDSVQLFFYASQMRPMSLASGDEPVQPEGMPQLSSQQNVLRT